MKSHEIDYKIIGNDIQLVEVELDPNETVIPINLKEARESLIVQKDGFLCAAMGIGLSITLFKIP